jgi:hypothetical protein
MIKKNLFEEVLIKPARESASELLIVSGFANATMAYYHLETLKRLKASTKVHLIVGMSPTEGISKSNHLGFQKLVQRDYPSYFECRYLMKKPSAHSKVYCWIKGKEPFKGFLGSANYTQTAFGDSQREVMDTTDAKEALKYFSHLYDETINCCDTHVGKIIKVYEEYEIRGAKKAPAGTAIVSGITGDLDLPHVRVTLLDREGDLPKSSGLNWGQRPQYKREPNQAYIRLDSSIYNTNFFPTIGKRFSVLTDDNELFVFSRAQQNGKALHTPENNSLIGKYFRKRLGVKLGDPVKLQDLVKYGRTNIDFYKIADDGYYLDFSV